MKKIEPYPIASALFFILEIFYIVCMVGKNILLNLGIDGYWHMHKIWQFIIPGFEERNVLSYILGFLIVGVGAYASVYVVIPIYNYLLSRSNKIKTQKPKPFKIRFKVLFFSISSFMLFLFVTCIIYDLIVPEYLNMSYIWHLLLPGFNDISIKDFLIGVLDIIIYSFYSSAVISSVVNYFERQYFVSVN